MVEPAIVAEVDGDGDDRTRVAEGLVERTTRYQVAKTVEVFGDLDAEE
jgi:hypothetical protein